MKKTVLTYGIISGIVISALMYLTMPFGKENPNFEMSEKLGYITMIISLSLIFFAIKSYRDKNNNGAISFGRGFKIGLFITLIAGVIYAAGWEIYYRNMKTDFMDQYIEYYKNNMAREGHSQAEIETQVKSMDAMREYYKNPAFRFMFTLLEILPVGILISLIAAALLKKKPVIQQS